MSDDKELNIEYCLRRDLDILRAMNDSKNKELTTLRRDIKDRLDDMYSMYDLWKEQNNQRQGSEPELISYNPDMTTCTLKYGDREYYFDLHHAKKTPAPDTQDGG